MMDQITIYLEDQSYGYYSHEETILDHTFEDVLLVWFTSIELVESLLTKSSINILLTFWFIYGKQRLWFD